MHVTVIIGRVYVGSTKFGEYLAQKHAEDARSIFVGEALRKWRQPIRANREALKRCQCGEYPEDCEFWSDLTGKGTTAFEGAEELVSHAREQGYDHVVDTTKRPYAINAYKHALDLDGDDSITVYWKTRPWISWARSVTSKSGQALWKTMLYYWYDGARKFWQAWWYADRLEWEGFNYYDIPENGAAMHCFGGNMNQYENA